MLSTVALSISETSEIFCGIWRCEKMLYTILCCNIVIGLSFFPSISSSEDKKKAEYIKAHKITA